MDRQLFVLRAMVAFCQENMLQMNDMLRFDAETIEVDGMVEREVSREDLMMLSQDIDQGIRYCDDIQYI